MARKKPYSLTTFGEGKGKEKGKGTDTQKKAEDGSMGPGNGHFETPNSDFSQRHLATAEQKKERII